MSIKSVSKRILIVNNVCTRSLTAMLYLWAGYANKYLSN